MPFKSKAQMRWMFAAEERGELPKGTAKRWLKHTKNVSKLPEKKKQKKEEKKSAAIQKESSALAAAIINTLFRSPEELALFCAVNQLLSRAK